MSRRFTFVIGLFMGAIIIALAWQHQESPDEAYERGKSEANWASLPIRDHGRLYTALGDGTDSSYAVVSWYMWLQVIVDEYGEDWRNYADTFFVATALYAKDTTLISCWIQKKTFNCWDYEPPDGWWEFFIPDSTDTLPAVDTVYSDSTGRQIWLQERDRERRRDSLAAMPDTIAVDSVDTMSSEPLYYEAIDVVKKIETLEFGRFRVWSGNIDRIDTVQTDPDTLHRVHSWYAQNDSTLCRYFEKTSPTTGRGADTLWCYRIQVHLNRGQEGAW